MDTTWTRNAAGQSIFTLSVVAVLLVTATGRAEITDEPIGEDEPILLAANHSENEYADLVFEELISVSIYDTGTLTEVSEQMIPSAYTTISSDQIWRSGARSLNELIDIYVPNTQFLLHHWEAPHLGARGLISDRDGQYLLRVNGRIMNEKGHYGALPERDLSLLGDLHQVTVVRGPGSATYGPGAVSMVVNLTTENGLLFQGTEVRGRVGAIEEFYAIEAKHGVKIDEDTAYYGYFGIEEYVGADQDYAPFRMNNSFTTTFGSPVVAENDVNYPINPANQAYRALPRMKAHLHLNDGSIEAWVRYTRGGYEFTHAQRAVANPPFGFQAPGTFTSLSDFGSNPGHGYQQLTAFIGYTHEINEEMTADLAFSYDLFDHERKNFGGTTPISTREDEYYFRAVVNWEPNDEHKIAIGTEYSHEEFGLDSPGFPGITSQFVLFDFPLGFAPGIRWAVDTISVFGEDQYTVNERWTVFSSIRMDANRFNDTLFSPRVSVVHTPNEDEAWKFMASRSVRMTFAEEQKANDILVGNHSQPEILDNLELRYERQQDENLSLASSVYFHALDVVAWDGAASQVGGIGQMKSIGIELEATYEDGPTFVTASHGYHYLINFKPAPGTSQLLTAEPFGGEDLAVWSPNITKVIVGTQLNEEVLVDASLRVYWGFPGAEDLDTVTRLTDGLSALNLSEPYGINAYLNFGIQMEPRENVTLRVDGYNLLGVIDEALNKRNFGFGDYHDYRIQAPAVAVSVKIDLN